VRLNKNGIVASTPPQLANPPTSPRRTAAAAAKMKLYSIIVLKVLPGDADPVICSSAVDVSDIGFFQRSSAKEFLLFLSRTIAKRITIGSRTQVNEKEHVIYAQSIANGALVVAAIADREYNSRVCFSLISSVASDFESNFRGKWEGPAVNRDDCVPWPELAATLTKYQDPGSADQILRIQKDIDETKIIMHQAIESVLDRGEKIDNLVNISADLGVASKGFYKSAKKTNSSCCVIC
jgi:synaptobrevin family protein YKT6